LQQPIVTKKKTQRFVKTPEATMKLKLFFWIVLLNFFWISCSNDTHQHISGDSVKKLDNGIVVSVEKSDQAKFVRLEVVSDDIIRVTATPRDSFSTEKSLMVLPDIIKSTRWSIAETDSTVIVSTTSLRAQVHRSTGEVVFTDTTGHVLLEEQRGGGKSFAAKNIEGKPYFSVQQKFLSPSDEAFYGLGGHQNGQMNYKNDDVELIQANIVDVIPFVYSNKNYGILWDNYSSSKFGDERDYQPLNTLTLYDKNGIAGGLSASYYAQGKRVKEAKESEINYEFLETPQLDNFPKDIAQNGKIVWEGYFSSDKEGAHKFLFYTSGYCKVWIDNELYLDKWRQNWNPWSNKFQVDIRNGEKHAIKIEWISEGGYLAVKHLDPITPEEQSKLSLWSEVADEIDYYFIRGNNADDVIGGYRTLTGKATIVPKWALGFWQSRERYKTQDEIIGTVKEYRKRGIPLDNIVLDWQYWEDPKWGSHEFDASRFPDPKGMIDQLHNQLHAQLMISVWPKFNTGTKHYEEMNRKGFLFTRNIEKKRKDWVGPGYESTFYDPFNPEAGKLFWNQIDRKLNRIGIDAWWLDATEPDIHSNISLEERKKNMSPTALGPGEKYFNAYSLLNSKSVYEGQRQSSPEKRVFILTRSSYAGQQRYAAATWSGDVVSRWSDLKDQVATGINFSISGIPYWTMDIGGFAVERRFENATGETLNEWQELNTRWFQFGAFCPLFRSHGQYPYREIFNISKEGSKPYESMVYYTKLRYRLMPYIYSLAGQSYHNNYTMMRGLIMDFGDDAKVAGIGDQYMFGPSILVAPVHEYKARTREVYLPAGTSWYDFESFKPYEGGQVIKVNAPLERVPLFVKSGSIIPFGPEIQYTEEKKADTLTLYIFPGQNGSFTIYEDENTNYNYEKGQFSTIELKYEEATRKLTIGKRHGEFPGMLKKRIFQMIWVRDHPEGGQRARPQRVIEYSGEEVTINF
jgi:alpha-D-xyloside xylohydrolase